MAQVVCGTPLMKATKVSNVSASKASVFGSVLPSQKLAAKSSRTSLNVVAREAMWAPGSEAPAHLDGSMAGDFGFDPLGLGVEPDRLQWFRAAELVHARFAMLATTGILVPDLLSKSGFNWAGAGVPWYEAGKFGYSTPIGVVIVTQIFLMGWAETRRWVDIKNPGAVNKDPIFGSSLPDGESGYPGGIFDPFGWSKGDMKVLQTKEIKNGRLAMLAFIGFAVQHQVTGGTPIGDLGAHLANPWDTTVLSNASDLFVWNWGSPSGILSQIAPLAASAGKP
eukprot:CAMPEP_0196572044 /NCGR_PEP_ID=MMETSP1081-20130531/2159_1 /TAXON_ID=36882 /ORGANISM="Pyramimonas amylifera, Strain CCMP720" /LENGTH=279 /DNA_ID=CAMNT_0041889225 /DNA_START=70 /DNA_END=909 /DNA_ORIENTATION=+